MDPEWVEKWEEDLAAAQEAIREKHPSPFDNLSSEEMQAEFETLAGRLPALDHHDVIVELARIVARLEDGHSRLTLPLAPGVDFMQGHSETEAPTLSEMQFGQFPIRFGLDAEGVWIQGAAKDDPLLLGSRLVSIDDRPVAEVLELVSSTIQRDNKMQVLHHLPMHLVLPELLHACGVTRAPDRASFVLDMSDGSAETVELSRVVDASVLEWVQVGSTSATGTSLSERRNDENFWFEYVESEDLVYLQFNEVYDKDEETIRHFSERLASRLKTLPDAALVIDLRHNRGGNQSLALPLLHAVLGIPQNRAGHLFTIIGRTTFSAAMTFSLQMEKHTQTLFVGEPTGSKPNHYGDSRKTLLPNSNVTLRISSLYWQWSPRDDRPWIAPHIDAPPTLKAELAGEDPAMRKIGTLLSGETDSEMAGEWRGNLSPASYGRDSVLRLEATGDSLTGNVDIPPFGLSEAPVEKLVVDSGQISFQTTIGSETILYSGRIRGSWIVGHGELGSVRYPFLMQRP
jgi:hypothetical protein